MPGELTTLQVNFCYPIIWTLTKHHYEEIILFPPCCYFLLHHTRVSQPSTSEDHHLTSHLHNPVFRQRKDRCPKLLDCSSKLNASDITEVRDTTFQRRKTVLILGLSLPQKYNCFIKTPLACLSELLQMSSLSKSIENFKRTERRN